MRQDEIKYSLIIPIYNEGEGILEMYRRTINVLDSLNGSVELLFVNDGSCDESLTIIRKLHHTDRRVCYLSFGRNFGHQVAVTAGLNFARGKAIIVIDGDLQDPPELIPEIVEKWHQGYEIVYAKRVQRHKESCLKRFTAYVFYRFIRHLADIDIPTDTGDFCLMDRKVVRILNVMPERNRYIRGLRAWVGFKQTAVYFERDPRFLGEAKYTFCKSLSLAVSSLVSFSKAPLRISTYLGFASATAALLMSFLVLYWRISHPDSPLTGLTMIMMLVFLLSSVQLISVGILGEYIGQIFEEVKNRPLYTLAEVGGFENQDN
ncbi:glycosyltransferase family 2 protein [Oscillatoria sp. CS-180]|uniref:glycosyltransferase family 2 protein n=1 Tax=Oscillatoria sp. CS-180 TaxID=3021720 RepID=UPI00232CA58F|nr:glycosyltransferase family 2 protein [Oscillatoria sp. CS-180]MDB9528816.1 glycosyltransferase family 2 protein [Oscillatoria sp. CS-180]